MRTHQVVALAEVVMLLAAIFGCSQNEPNPTAVVVNQPSFSVVSGPLSGAIFTTTVDGAIVNENVHYLAKEDVYLDGGPGPNAPAKAAGLPEGDYYFQVTDPSGKDLLSTDHISCRKIHVNDHGVIDFVYSGTSYVKSKGSLVTEPCQHAQGVDLDHSELGAITVQLFPYDDTPNRGGVYKVWITPVDRYIGDPDYVPTKLSEVNGEHYEPGNYHGFDPRWSKTDNYKVKRQGPPCESSSFTVKKFHDANLNGVMDAGETEVTGWAVDITDPTGVTNTVYTPATVLTNEPGDYIAVEDTPAGTRQTVSYLDGAQLSLYPSADPTVVVSVAEACSETHAVVYGNVGVTGFSACKVYDTNGNGVVDEGEGPVAGWAMTLSGTDILGAVVGPITQMTGEDGCTTFGDLLPGDYTVAEVFPASGNWTATGPTSYSFTLTSSLPGGSAGFTFTNYCYGEADFGTKGYWHNKNGLSELSFDPDILYVNGLVPYASASDYFDDGDEPFDGFYGDGTPVAGVNGDWGELIAPAGSWQAEVSRFLVDANAGGDPREQLAQQLLAFIFNVQHRLDGMNTSIELPDGTLASAGSLIDAAIDEWTSGDAEGQDSLKSLLDALNNNDAVHYIHAVPCSVLY